MAAGVALSACGRKLASRFSGLLYVARRAQRSVAIIDLAQFRWSGEIDLPTPPTQLVRAGKQIFAVCPGSLAIFPLDLEQNRAGTPIRLPSAPGALLVRRSDPSFGIVTSVGSSQVFALHLPDRAVTARVHLPSEPAGYDDSGSAIAFAMPGRRAVALLDPKTLQTLSVIETGASPRSLRFRFDGKTILAGAWQEKQIISLDTAKGVVLTKLPVPIAPQRFCFNADGGQMFVSGTGADVVTIVNPYQNEIDQTILAGRTPGAMLTMEEPGLLLVANPDAGDLTIIDIDTRRLSASVHVGQKPGSVMVTPNNEFALVLNRESGSVAVIRLKTVLDHKNKTKPLFTVVPVGAEPVSGVILPIET